LWTASCFAYFLKQVNQTLGFQEKPLISHETSIWRVEPLKNGLDSSQKAETDINDLHFRSNLYKESPKTSNKPEQVQIKMILCGSSGVVSNLQLFKKEVIADLSFAVTVNPASLEIVSFHPNETDMTIVVNIVSNPGDLNYCDTWKSASEVAIQLEDQAKDPLSRLLLGIHTCKIISFSIVSCYNNYVPDYWGKTHVGEEIPTFSSQSLQQEINCHSFLLTESLQATLIRCSEQDPKNMERHELVENSGTNVTGEETRKQNLSGEKTSYHEKPSCHGSSEDFIGPEQHISCEGHDEVHYPFISGKNFAPNNLPLIACVSVQIQQDLSSLNQKLKMMTKYDSEQGQHSTWGKFDLLSAVAVEITENNLTAASPIYCSDQSKRECELKNDSLEDLQIQTKIQKAAKLQGLKLNACLLIQVQI
jgi:hypothetical protein